MGMTGCDRRYAPDGISGVIDGADAAGVTGTTGAVSADVVVDELFFAAVFFTAFADSRQEWGAWMREDALVALVVPFVQFLTCRTTSATPDETGRAKSLLSDLFIRTLQKDRALALLLHQPPKMQFDEGSEGNGNRGYRQDRTVGHRVASRPVVVG